MWPIHLHRFIFMSSDIGDTWYFHWPVYLQYLFVGNCCDSMLPTVSCTVLHGVTSSVINPGLHCYKCMCFRMLYLAWNLAQYNIVKQLMHKTQYRSISVYHGSRHGLISIVNSLIQLTQFN